MTFISIDVDRHDYDTLVRLLERDKENNYSVLYYAEQCLIEDIVKDMDRGLPDPKIDEPLADYTVISGILDDVRVRFVRDGSPGMAPWLCLNNHIRYYWDKIKNPEIIK